MPQVRVGGRSPGAPMGCSARVRVATAGHVVCQPPGMHAIPACCMARVRTVCPASAPEGQPAASLPCSLLPDPCVAPRFAGTPSCPPTPPPSTSTSWALRPPAQVGWGPFPEEQFAVRLQALWGSMRVRAHIAAGFGSVDFGEGCNVRAWPRAFGSAPLQTASLARTSSAPPT